MLREPEFGDKVEIAIAEGADDICKGCPHLKEQKCASEIVPTLDENHATILKLKAGDKLCWGIAKKRIADNMTLDSFEKACGPCFWKQLGFCKEALIKLYKEAKTVKTLLVLLMLSFAAANDASAASAQAPAPKNTQINFETYKQHLEKNRKHKTVVIIKRTVHSIRQKWFTEAKKTAQVVQKNILFADYGYFLFAEASKNQAQEQLKKRRFASARENANKAKKAYFRITTEFPYSPFFSKIQQNIADAELIVAASFISQKQFTQARPEFESAFQRLQNENSLNLLRPEDLSLYFQSCLKRRGPLCASWLNRFIQLYPAGSEELRAISKHAPVATEKAQPIRFATKLTQTYRSPDLDQVALDGAMSVYQEGKYSKAVDLFEQFLVDFPNSTHRHRVRFWLAQALTQDQEHDKASKLYDDLMAESPLGYYGMLAAISSGKPLDSLFTATLPDVTTTETSLHPLESMRLLRAEAFIAGGLNELALQELKDLRPRDYLSNSFLLYLATLNYEAGSYIASFVILSDLINRGYEGVYSSHGLRLVFPLVYFDQIQRTALQQKLDPVLVLSLIKQESAFDSGVLSPAGAMGLMQLMPTTALEVEPDVKRADLTLLDTNTRIGTKYFRKLLNKYNGNIALSLAAYNAGPGSVDRWVREGRAKRGLLEFIEQIPYKETREYVATIIRNYFWYSKKINGETIKSIDYFWNVYGPPVPPPSDNSVIQNM